MYALWGLYIVTLISYFGFFVDVLSNDPGAFKHV